MVRVGKRPPVILGRERGDDILNPLVSFACEPGKPCRGFLPGNAAQPTLGRSRSSGDVAAIGRIFVEQAGREHAGRKIRDRPRVARNRPRRAAGKAARKAVSGLYDLCGRSSIRTSRRTSGLMPRRLCATARSFSLRRMMRRRPSSHMADWSRRNSASVGSPARALGGARLAKPPSGAAGTQSLLDHHGVRGCGRATHSRCCQPGRCLTVCSMASALSDHPGS